MSLQPKALNNKCHPQAFCRGIVEFKLAPMVFKTSKPGIADLMFNLVEDLASGSNLTEVIDHAMENDYYGTCPIQPCEPHMHAEGACAICDSYYAWERDAYELMINIGTCSLAPWQFAEQVNYARTTGQQVRVMVSYWPVGSFLVEAVLVNQL